MWEAAGQNARVDVLSTWYLDTVAAALRYLGSSGAIKLRWQLDKRRKQGRCRSNGTLGVASAPPETTC